MTSILFIFSFVTLMISIILCLNTKKTKRQLLSLIKETKRVANSDLEKVVLFQTNDKIIQKMCVELNEIISQNSQIKNEYIITQNTLFHTLSNISHDIKTPLATSLGYLELLEKKYSSDRATQKIKSKLMEVNKIINQFSIISKIDSNDFLFSPESININEFCRQILFSFNPLFKKEGFNVEIHIPEKSITICSDPYAITSILENLINNALIHGKDGKYFSFELIIQSKNIVMIFTDKGKGIDSKNINQIFDRTFMADVSRNTKNQGSGLGLAIVKEYLTLIDGNIEVSSLPFIKTTFTISFPISLE